MKIALRNSKYVAAELGTGDDGRLRARSDSVGGWETFEVFEVLDDGSLLPLDEAIGEMILDGIEASGDGEPDSGGESGGSNPPSYSSDDIDLSQAVIASPDCPDVRTLPVISWISEIQLMEADQGYSMNFPGRDTWPGVTPPGWDGPINHTLWMCELINGTWYILPVKEGLHDYLTLGPILEVGQVPNNLTYYAQSPMLGYQPRPREMVGFFATTGDTRRMNVQIPGAGRTNVMLVPFTEGVYHGEGSNRGSEDNIFRRNEDSER